MAAPPSLAPRPSLHLRPPRAGIWTARVWSMRTPISMRTLSLHSTRLKPHSLAPSSRAEATARNLLANITENATQLFWAVGCMEAEAAYPPCNNAGYRLSFTFNGRLETQLTSRRDAFRGGCRDASRQLLSYCRSRAQL